jgi:predicted GNAT family acetyltransferase
MPFQTESDKITYSVDGSVLAEVDFPEVSPGLRDITHTFVDDTLRGQGIAGQLMERVAAQLRSENKKARLTCSYAQSWFGKNPEYSDIVEKS